MLAKFLFFYIIYGRKRINLSENCLMKKILCLICLFSVSFYSCAVRNYLGSQAGLSEDRVFYAQMINNGNTAGWFNIPAHLLKVSDNLAIYLQNGKNISAYALNKLAQEFDCYYTSMTNIYGTHSDIDANGKIIILLMDINKTKGGSSQVLGYFNPSDMHGNNKGEILYMDLINANDNTDKAIGTIIHEFQHLINYSYVISGERNEMSSWLNEALSESTSILFNKTTAESRINEFNNINYYCFYTWNAPKQRVTNGNDNKVTTNGLFNYPSASVFMHWLYQKNGSNETIFQTIASPKGLSDYNKVLSAAKGISGYSVNSWDGLLLDWMSEIVTNGLTPSWNSSVKATNNCASGNVNLYPGAMIVCDNYTNGASGNIVTNKVNGSSGKTIVLNKDTNLKGLPVKVSNLVSTSQTSSKARTRRSAIRNDNNEESIDINILLDRNGNIKKD